MACSQCNDLGPHMVANQTARLCQSHTGMLNYNRSVCSQLCGLADISFVFVFVQFLWETATGQLVVAQWGVAVAVGAAGVMATYRWLDTSGKSNSQVQELRRDWPAWSATLLLVLQPLEQLVRPALDAN